MGSKDKVDNYDNHELSSEDIEIFKNLFHKSHEIYKCNEYKKTKNEKSLNNDLVINLEEGLENTKKNLQHTIEQLKNSNEKLEYFNKELLDTNEELKASNKELMSVSEKLYDLNSEYEEKVKNLKQLNEEIFNYFSNTRIPTIFVDNDLNITRYTPDIKSIINVVEGDKGKPIYSINNNLKGSFIEDINRTVSEGITIEKEVNMKDGTYMIMKINPYYTECNVIRGAVMTFMDITELKIAENKIRYMAYHDILTGLSNKTTLEKHFKEFVNKHEVGKFMSVIFIDIDRFKNINDTFGHETGDEILKKLAKILSNVVKNHGEVCRIGGDEFIILARNKGDLNEIKTLVEKIQREILNKFIIDDINIKVTLSIGASLYPKDAINFNCLIKKADIAMYRAKECGKNNFKFYSNAMDQEAVEKIKIERNLNTSDFQNEMSIYYQPQIDIKSEKIVGVEALLRWNSKEFGMVPPSKFIPVAEESGLINKIGQWVFKEVCRQIKEWELQGIRLMKVSINVSINEFNNNNFLENINNILRQSEVDPKCIEIEITERVGAKSLENVISILDQIHKMGISIAIDDFGIGYSSLSYIKKYKIDTLKIDKSLIDQITLDEDYCEIIKAIVSIAKTLNLKIIGEGIEKKEQMEFLLKEGCRIVQGYYYCKPISSDEFKEYFTKHNF